MEMLCIHLPIHCVLHICTHLIRMLSLSVCVHPDRQCRTQYIRTYIWDTVTLALSSVAFSDRCKWTVTRNCVLVRFYSPTNRFFPGQSCNTLMCSIQWKGVLCRIDTSALSSCIPLRRLTNGETNIRLLHTLTSA